MAGSTRKRALAGERDLPDPIQFWDDVQAGLLRRFPNGYWVGMRGQQRAEAICRELLRRRNITTIEQVGQLTQADFKAVYLRGMLAQVYSESPYHALKVIFPALEPWHMTRAPRDVWQGPDGCSHALRALRWLLREGRCVGGRLSLVCIAKSGLRGMLKYVFDDRLDLAVRALATGECPPTPRADYN